MNATLINHILSNDFLKTGTFIQVTISDHFPIFLVTSFQFLNNIQDKTIIIKRNKQVI